MKTVGINKLLTVISRSTLAVLVFTPRRAVNVQADMARQYPKGWSRFYRAEHENWRKDDNVVRNNGINIQVGHHW